MKKYVFFDDIYDQGHILMRDLEKHPDCHVVYHGSLFQNRFAILAHRILFSVRVERMFRIPFKHFWLKLLYRNHINSNTKVITLAMNWYTKRWIDFLKTAYPNAKLVLVLRDTVLAKTALIKDFQIEEAKQWFDLILSYDNIHDVPVYGLTYAPVYMSVVDELKSSKHECKYDTCWIALAKDRMKLINSLYQQFTAHGLKTFFYILRAKESDKLPDSNIIYGDCHLDRVEMLRKQLESNCILEVLKGDALSCTLRFWEAVIYNKKLYTNWKGVVDSPYYDPRYIKVFSNPEDIDYDFIKERIDVDYNYQGELSPLRYLEIFENSFGN